ncbi:hypothetical protein ACEWY4_006018 [Coilia grayii]|uniref:DDE Tnp4 domain-containing protein n=1 Tax=Coilia grayii TaxID=363190 RepID=A0ABD1KCT0_9TELE
MDIDSPDFVPSVFAYTAQREDPQFNRKRRRDESTIRQLSDETSLSEQLPSAEEEDLIPRYEYNSLCERYNQLQEECASLRQDVTRLTAENERLREDLKASRFCYNTIRSDIPQFLFLTGLQIIVFNWLIQKLSGTVDTVCKKLSLQDHLLVVLMKLKIGFSNKYLAYKFNVSNSTISNICRAWIPTMATVLKPLIKWPSKGAVLKSLPHSFKNFKRCRCIIDCTGIFIDRPTNVTARAQTWSNYKHSNTIKYLIGISPAGAITFISSGWGDKQITRESGILNLLEQNDEVLADRGFLIRDDLAALGVTLRIPSFTKGKKQLAAHEVDRSRQLSRVRIHVECVIGRWKTFKILQTVIPVSQVDMLDDIVIICAALTNLCNSVVTK